MKRTGRRRSSESSDTSGTSCFRLPVSGAVPSRSRYAPPEFSVSAGKVSVAVPGAAPAAARWKRTRSLKPFSTIDRSSSSAFESSGSNA